MGLRRKVADPFGIACPGRHCGTYWSEKDDSCAPCGCGGHTVRTCSGCGFDEWLPPPGPDCED